GEVFEAVHPVSREIPQSRLLPVSPDPVAEQKRLSDRQLRRGRVSSDLLVFAYVGGLLLFRSHEGPYLFNLLPPYEEEARALRSIGPFVEARTEIVAPEVLLLEREVSERMGPVDDDLDPLGTSQFAHFLDRRDLSCNIDHVRD